MDGFLDMLPGALQDHPDGIAYRPGPQGTTVTVGPVGRRLPTGMRAVAAAMADAGCDLVLDTCAADPAALVRRIAALVA